MKKIYKYQLRLEDRQKISMPKKAELLHVAEQEDRVWVWALVETDNPIVEREVRVLTTGHPLWGIDSLKHIGTFMILDGDFVGHVFG